MKKKIALLLGTVCAATCVCGVGCKKNYDGGEQDLQIYVLEQGYGRDWAEETAKAFAQQEWVKEKYPELTIDISYNDNVGYASNQMTLGSKENYYDLMMGALLEGYYGTTDVLDLTDVVYNEKVPEEGGITYKEKLNASLTAAFAVDKKGETKYYGVPYFSGQYGIIYNMTELAKYTTEVPRTTDELIAVCNDIKSAGKYAFTWGKDADYFEKEGGIMEVWWAQYNGLEAYDNYWNGINVDEYSNKIFEQKGRLYSLSVLETLLKRSNGYFDPDEIGKQYMTAQQRFMMGSAVFHYNGDYFIDEMKDTLKDMEAAGYTYSEVNMMRTPILSDIIELCPSIEDDTELSALVKAIDAGSTSITGEGYSVEATDFAKICEARGIVGSVGPGQAIVPSYAKAKDVAVDFLRFMATDIGIAAYAKGTQGSTIDFKVNLQQASPDLYDSLSPLHKDRLALMNATNLTPTILRKGSTYPLSVYGLEIFANHSWDGDFIGGQNTTAQAIFEATKRKWDANTFDDVLRRAGFLK